MSRHVVLTAVLQMLPALFHQSASVCPLNANAPEVPCAPDSLRPALRSRQRGRTCCEPSRTKGDQVDQSLEFVQRCPGKRQGRHDEAVPSTRATLFLDDSGAGTPGSRLLAPYEPQLDSTEHCRF